MKRIIFTLLIFALYSCSTEREHQDMKASFQVEDTTYIFIKGPALYVGDFVKIMRKDDGQWTEEVHPGERLTIEIRVFP